MGMIMETKGTEGKGNKGLLFVKLIQIVWAEGEIPQQMTWITVVLLPKGGGN